MAVGETPSSVVTNLFAALRQLTVDDGYQHIQGVLDENVTIRQHYENAEMGSNYLRKVLHDTEKSLEDMKAKYDKQEAVLESSNKENIGVAKRLKETEQLLEAAETGQNSQAARIAELMVEVGELTVKLQAEESQSSSANSARKYAEKQRDDAQKELSKTKTTLDEKREKLKKLEARAVPLKDSIPLETIGRTLAPLFDEAKRVIKQYLPTELDKTQLQGPSELLKELQAKTDLPLPLSNTPAALKMRELAALACLGGALAENIFQPVYANDPEGRDLLRNLARTDLERESYVRRVLLSVAGRYEELAGYRVQRTVAEVMFCVAPLLVRDTERAIALRKGLQKVCETAAKEWHRLQSFKERVEASVEVMMTDEQEATFAETEKGYWRVLPFSLHDTQASPSGTSTNGASTNGAAANGATPKKTGKRGKSPAPLLECRDIKAVIWPTFTSVPGNGSEPLILAGTVVTIEQVAAAQMELISGTGPLKRRRTGKRGQPSSYSNGSGEPFLWQEGGSGSKEL